MTGFLKAVIKNAAYALAVMIIAAAVLVIASRFATPILDEHRADFEKIASDLLQNPVSIENVRVSWYRYQPMFNLNRVTILDKSTEQPALQIKKVSIFFSIPQSIWQRKLVPSGIMVDGADLDIYEKAKGDFTLRGFPSLGGFQNAPYKNESRFYDVAGFLSTQPRLILRNIDLRYTDFMGKQRYVTLYNLDFKNEGAAHSVYGKALLHQDVPTEIILSGQWEGNPDTLDFHKITAKVYLYISGLSLPQWAKGFTWQGWEIKKGIASAKMWATWSEGEFKKIQTTFQFFDLNLYSKTDNTTHRINRFSGNAGWKRDGQNQEMAGDEILIDLPAHLWPVTSFYISMAADPQGKLVPKAANVGYVDLVDVQSFLLSFPGIFSEANRQLINGIHLKGGLQHTTLTFNGAWNDWQRINLHSSFSQIGLSPWKSFPGFTHLTGKIKWNGQQGEVALNTRQSTFKHNTVFGNDINIDQLSGNIQWFRDANQAWILRFGSLQMLNVDLAANVNGTLTFPVNSGPFADMAANLSVQKANHVSRYLPLKIFGPDLVEWLNQAFLAGEATSGHAELKGLLSDFPYKNGNGTFLITGLVKEVDLRYAADWPILRHINGRLTFLNNKMIADIERSNTFNIMTNHIHAEIPDLSHPVITIAANRIDTNFRPALNFVHISPLEKSIGKMVAGMDLTGEIGLTLSLKIPLENTDNATVQGDLVINNSELQMPPWNLALSHLNGNVQFTESSTSAKNLTCLLFNKPFAFNLLTLPKKKEQDKNIVQANFNTHLAMADVEAWLKIPLSSVVQGAADFEGVLNFALNAPIELQLKSDLAGVAVNLPYEYSKNADDETEFYLKLTATEKAPLRLKIGYDDLLNAALILERKNDKFNLIGADLRLGAGEAEWPATPGLYISGNFDQLDWGQLKKYIGQSKESGFNHQRVGPAAFSTLTLRGIDLTVKKLDLSGINFSDLRIQVKPATNYWNVNLTSPDVVGHLDVPLTLSPATSLAAQFQKLKIHMEGNSIQHAFPINAKALPQISFAASHVEFNDRELGQVTFKTIPSANGLAIQSLRLGSSRLDLQASGDWTSGNVTHLNGRANSNQLSSLLSEFGLDARNFVVQKGNLLFNLNWKDAPYSPAYSSLNGSVSIDIGQGRIVDIGKESGAKMGLGQLLNIFNLQSIPRRLSFDFSDIFQKGYSFDYIRGDFNLQNGDLYTTNLRIDGPVARVDINGQIGLKNRVYNLILSVTANVTSSIPVAATLLTGNPLIGLGALAVNTVIGSQVSKVTTHYYSVTGPWGNPTWTGVSGNQNR